MPPETKPPLRIAHPFRHIRAEDRIKMQSSIPQDINNYLFKRVLPEFGHQAAIIAFMLERLYQECQRRKVGLRPGVSDAIWDEENESRVAEILADLNFNQPTDTNVQRKHQRTPRTR